MTDEIFDKDTQPEDQPGPEEGYSDAPVDGPKYPVQENGVPELSELKLTPEDSTELFDEFLASRYGSEYISAKLQFAVKKNEDGGYVHGESE